VCRKEFQIPKNGIAGLPVRTHDQEPAQCFRSVHNEIKQLTSRIECFRGAMTQLVAENNKRIDNMKTLELEVKKRCKEMRQLVDRQETVLLRELQSMNSDAEEDVQSHAETLQMATAKLESFRTSLELRAKDAKDAHDRAKQMLQTHVVPSEYHAPSYKFTPVKIDELLRDGQNFVGHVVKVRDSGTIKSYCRDVSAADFVCLSLHHNKFNTSLFSFVVYILFYLLKIIRLIYLQRFTYVTITCFR